MNSKHCPRCHYTGIIKFGKVRGRQRYRCRKCGKTWLNHTQTKRLEQEIWDDFARGGMNITKLARNYNCSTSKIRRILKAYPLPKLTPCGPAKAVVMDATYFGRRWGVLLVLNAITGEPLYCQRIGGYERIEDYLDAIQELARHDIVPEACVIDGKRGVRRMLLHFGFLVQVCQFHQIQTVIQNTTRKPDLEPNQELLDLARRLPHMNSTDFAVAILGWQIRYGHWVEERTYLPDNPKKFHYTHQKSRRAFNSLRNNRKYLFTYEEHPELRIPKTSNIIEGRFGIIKTKLLCHRGCSDELKWKLFLDLLINGVK